MAEFLILLLRRSLLGTLLAGLLVLLRLLCRRRLSPTVYCWLWLPVLLRLCIPGGVLLPLPAGPQAAPAPAGVYAAAPAEPGQTVPGQAAASPAAPAPAAPAEPAPLATLGAALRSPGLWAAVWAAGALAILGWYLGGYLRFSRRLRGSFAPPPPAAAALLQELRPGSRVGLAVSPLARTPLLLGVLQPVIVLPAGLEEPLWRDVLAHELAHARRLDLPYKWLAALAACLHWFNPAMALVRREVGRACELACDEAVLRSMTGEQRRHYGETLLTLAAGQAPGRQRLTMALLEGKQQLRQRLTAIALYQKRGALSAGLSLLAALAVGGCALVAGVAPQSASSPYESYRAALLGEAPILCRTGEGDASLTIGEVPALFSPESDYAEVWRFALVDLDGDGGEEVLLQVIDVAGDMGGFLVLHQEEETLLGYPRSYREFASLKTDGSYEFSTALGTEWGVGAGSFSQGAYTVQTLVGGRIDTATQATEYTLSGQPATEEDYNAAMALQRQKPDVPWYEFTAQQINVVLAEGAASFPVSGPVLSDQEAREAAQAIAADFMAYWETAGEGMVLPTAHAFCSPQVAGMDMAVFIVYPEYKSTRTVVYSVADGVVQRIGELPSGFAFELSAAQGGLAPHQLDAGGPRQRRTVRQLLYRLPDRGRPGSGGQRPGRGGGRAALRHPVPGRRGGRAAAGGVPEPPCTDERALCRGPCCHL